jgi:hypothetical protein
MDRLDGGGGAGQLVQHFLDTLDTLDARGADHSFDLRYSDFGAT